MAERFAWAESDQTVNKGKGLVLSSCKDSDYMIQAGACRIKGRERESKDEQPTSRGHPELKRRRHG